MHVINALLTMNRTQEDRCGDAASEGGVPEQSNSEDTRTGSDMSVASGTESLIKSRQRVADHGEVFTPPWLVEKMLDLVKGETERIDSRFLEPACGSGNFLIPILQRKLAAVEARYGKSEFERTQYALLALMCCYGIELLADNARECRANMLDVFAEYLDMGPEDQPVQAAEHILALNIIQGDAMTMRDVAGAPITVVEWGYLGKGKFNRRDFRLDVLTGMAEFREEQSLFRDVASHDIFKPLRHYPIMNIADLAAKATDMAA